MSKETFVKTLGFIVIISGLAVITGWIYDIPVLKSVYPSWASMKFAAALSFVMSGFILYFLADTKKERLAVKQIILSGAALGITLIMGTFLASGVFGMYTGIEHMFIRDIAAPATFFPGRPSIAAMVCFILTALSAIFTLLELDKLKFLLRAIGVIIALIGLTAVIGYLLGMPALYYSVKNFNNPIAFHAAALFVIIGIGIFMGSDLR